MPRSGPNGTYTLPGAQATQQPGTPIPSAVNNQGYSDIEQTFNTIQPRAYGGTDSSDLKLNDANFGVRNNADATKIGVFNASGLPTATTRTYDLPYYSGTLGLVSNFRGSIYGLAISNDSGDLTNDIRVTAGTAVDSTGTTAILLSSTLIKRTDAAWAAGSGNGGWLDGASMPNGTGHVFLMWSPTTGVVDIGLSASLTPTFPSGFTQTRRIGSVIRELAALVLFYQNGDVFMRSVAVTDRNNTAAFPAALLAVSVPNGIVVAPLLRFRVDVGVSVLTDLSIGSAAQGAVTATILTIGTGAGDSADIQVVTIPPVFFTNGSRQIYFSQTNTTGTPTASNIVTLGWVDRRGQDGLA